MDDMKEMLELYKKAEASKDQKTIDKIIYAIKTTYEEKFDNPIPNCMALSTYDTLLICLMCIQDGTTENINKYTAEYAYKYKPGELS